MLSNVIGVFVRASREFVHILRGVFAEGEKGGSEESRGQDEERECKGDSGERSNDVMYRVFKVFLGSPDGLEEEKKAFCEEVNFVNTTQANPRSVHFQVVRWEDIPPDYGRPQSIIDGYLKECQCYVLILWERWGSPPGSNEGSSYSSGSEEEFSLAEEWLSNPDARMRKIVVFFKSVDSEKWNSPDAQLEKVKSFRIQLQQENKLLYKEFAGIGDFRKYVQAWLAKWVYELTEPAKARGVQSVLDYEEPGKKIGGAR